MLVELIPNFRKVQEVELENALLRDPNSRGNRLHRLGYSRTAVATSGHFAPSVTSLLACIRIICEQDFSSEPRRLGAGRFGICYLRALGHYKACVKVFKHYDNHAFCKEANIVSKFVHPNLPYLFGVCVGDSLSTVTSFHGFADHTVTIYDALFGATKISEQLTKLNWKDIILQVLSGLEQLHVRYIMI